MSAQWVCSSFYNQCVATVGVSHSHPWSIFLWKPLSSILELVIKGTKVLPVKSCSWSLGMVLVVRCGFGVFIVCLLVTRFFFGGGGGGVKIIMHIYNPLKSYVHVTTYLLRTQLESIFPEGNMGTYMFKMLRSWVSWARKPETAVLSNGGPLQGFVIWSVLTIFFSWQSSVKERKLRTGECLEKSCNRLRMSGIESSF